MQSFLAEGSGYGYGSYVAVLGIRILEGMRICGLLACYGERERERERERQRERERERERHRGGDTVGHQVLDVGHSLPPHPPPILPLHGYRPRPGSFGRAISLDRTGDPVTGPTPLVGLARHVDVLSNFGP